MFRNQRDVYYLQWMCFLSERKAKVSEFQSVATDFQIVNGTYTMVPGIHHPKIFGQYLQKDDVILGEGGFGRVVLGARADSHDGTPFHSYHSFYETIIIHFI